MLALLLLLATPDLDGMVKLTNGTNMAYACPTDMGLAYTNRHVVQNGSQWIWGVLDGEQSHGIAEVAAPPDLFRDLAIVRPVSEQRFPRWYPLAKDAPKVGDKVWFLGYDHKDESKAFGPKRFEGTVTRLFNGHLVFKPAGQPGSSGSCILNSNEETVAINQGGSTTENGGDVGIGVGVWGDWLNLRRDDAGPSAETLHNTIDE